MESEPSPRDHTSIAARSFTLGSSEDVPAAEARNPGLALVRRALFTIVALSLVIVFGIVMRTDRLFLPSVIYPVSDRTITSDFGFRIHPIARSVKFHSGVDVRAAEGEEIRAVSDGVVTFSGKRGGYGNIVSILHLHGISTHYAHCQKRLVKTGDTVTAGQVIATAGRTGAVTGAHLHLEVRVIGAPTDPKRLLPALQIS